MISEFLRTQAGWRLVNAQHDPVRTARCAAALLDAAAYAATLRDDDPDLAALGRTGCFRGEVFDPGPRGISLARWWQFGDGEQHARPRDLIAALAVQAGACRCGSHRRPGQEGSATCGSGPPAAAWPPEAAGTAAQADGASPPSAASG